MIKESRKQSKRQWTDFEITRIRLEPEQAVLSCCDGTNRNAIDGTTQCGGACLNTQFDGLSS